MCTDEKSRKAGEAEIDDEKLITEIKTLAAERQRILAGRDDLWKNCAEGAAWLKRGEELKPEPNKLVQVEVFASYFQQAREASACAGSAGRTSIPRVQIGLTTRLVVRTI